MARERWIYKKKKRDRCRVTKQNDAKRRADVVKDRKREVEKE